MPRDDFPRLGLGTYTDSDRAGRKEAVERALEAGYRHVDTAEVYGNEEYVGAGIEASDVPREEIFLATKVVHNDVPGPEYEDVVESFHGCLDRLGVDYVDLLYVHWPVGVYDPDVTLAAFDDLYDEGLIRNVGLSNFTPELLDEARDRLDAPLFAHQVEMHPLLQQEELREYAVEHDHYLVAYTPLGKGRVFDAPEVQTVAAKHGVSEARVSLAWLLEKENVAAIPKATGEDHLRDNLAALDLELDEEDVARIDSIDREERVIDPDWAPWN